MDTRMTVSLPRLLTRPFIKPRQLYGIEYRSTLFGVHVPRRTDPTLTDTWLLTFQKREDATIFADDLHGLRDPDGAWPCRIMTGQPKKTSISPDVAGRGRKHGDEASRRRPEGLRIRTFSERALARRCALSGLRLRVGKKAKGGYIFEASRNSQLYTTTSEDVVRHLEKLMPDDE